MENWKPRWIAAALCAILFTGATGLSLSACGTSAGSPQEASPASSLPASPSDPWEGDPSESQSGNVADGPIRLTVADAAMYRGVVQTLEEPETGGTALVLKRALGTSFSPDELTLVLDGDTQLSFPKEELREGAYLEVYYGVPAEGAPEDPDPPRAIAVNQLLAPESSVCSAMVRTIDRQDNGRVSLLVETLPDPEASCPVGGISEEIVFHISEATQVYLDLDTLQEGDGVCIFTNGIQTHSLPPQASALEIARIPEADLAKFAESPSCPFPLEEAPSN